MINLWLAATAHEVQRFQVYVLILIGRGFDVKGKRVTLGGGGWKDGGLE